VTGIRNEYGGLVGKSEVKRPLGRPRHRWEDNIRAYLTVTGWVMLNVFIWLKTGTRGELL
jgi:hypothetical protein